MKPTHRLRALALVALAALVAAGAAFAATRHAAVAPTNQSPPSITGDPNVGSTLTASPGTWNGSSPISYQYQWQVCGSDGKNCHAISGATDKTYVVESGDQGNTLRVHVIAGNSDGSGNATSDPTPEIKAAATATTTAAATTTTQAQTQSNGCPKTTAGSSSVAASAITAPARLQIASFSSSVRPITLGTSAFSVRFHVSDTCGQAVSGANVYATAVPYNQFSIPRGTTDQSGNVTLSFNRLRGFPAAQKQQLLVMFVRASRAGDNVLAGISTRRLVSLSVKLHG